MDRIKSMGTEVKVPEVVLVKENCHNLYDDSRESQLYQPREESTGSASP